jgi:hypothetical protein
VRDHCTEAEYGVVPGRQSMKVREWPLLGLLLVVSFLGHDLLMAREVVAAPRPEVGSAHHRSDAHASRSDTHAPQTQEPTPYHPDSCQIGQSAVARNDNAYDNADLGLAAGPGVVDCAAVAAPHTRATLWEEPRWPPGTLRALFQVYRI